MRSDSLGQPAPQEKRRFLLSPNRPAGTVPRWVRLLFSEYLVLILSLVYFVVMLPLIPGFATFSNLANLVSNLLPLLVVALGQTFVLIAGGIDLSVTSIIALASITGGFIMTSDGGWLAAHPAATPVAIVAMLGTGAAVGWLNGGATAWLKMPPFIVTLTTSMFFSGLAIWLTQSKTLYGLPAGFVAIGATAWISLVWVMVLALLAHAILSWSLMGRWLYAVGFNARTALVSGVPANRVLIFAYVMSGLCAAVASILFTGRLETASPVHGQKILLDVIGATVIGGTSLFGGRGKVLWTLYGVWFFTLIDNSLTLEGLSQFAVMMIKGAVILLAAFMDALRNRILAGKV